MLTRTARSLLRQASELITKQLMETGEVSIHGFGKFYLSRVEVAKGVHESGLPAEATGVKHRNVVRFRPWEGLKRQVNSGEILIVQEAPGEMEHKQEQSFVGVQPMPEPTDQLYMKDYKACIFCEASIPAGSADCSECGLPQEE